MVSEFCHRGHDDWIVRSDRRRACRTCRRDSVTRVRAKRAESRIKLPSAGASKDFVDWEPLQAQFDKLHMAPGWYVGERSVTRWRKAGRIPLITADEICCRVFRLHPYEVYGDDYFGGSDGT